MGPRNAVLGARDACEFRHWDLRWSSLWRHEAPYWAQETHASSTTRTFGGAPYGATKRCTGCGGACGLCHWDLRWGSLWGHETPPLVGDPHANCATGTFGGAPSGATKRVRCVPKWVARTYANCATGTFGGAPSGATKRVRGVPKWARSRMQSRPLGPSWAFGGVPYGATKRCPGLGKRMRAPPLGPSVELPMGPRNAALGEGTACELRHWDLWWSSLRGHEACEGCAEIGGGAATRTAPLGP